MIKLCFLFIPILLLLSITGCKREDTVICPATIIEPENNLIYHSGDTIKLHLQTEITSSVDSGTLVIDSNNTYYNEMYFSTKQGTFDTFIVYNILSSTQLSLQIYPHPYRHSSETYCGRVSFTIQQ